MTEEIEEYWNNTSKFLMPAFEFKPNDVEMFNFLDGHGFVNAYLCKQYKTKANIYLRFKVKKLDNYFIEFNKKIKDNKNYQCVIFIPNGEVHYIFEFPIDKYESIYIPFINEKWKKMDKNYRTNNFCRQYIYNGQLKVNQRWLVLNTGVSIPRLDIEREVYDYNY